MKVRVIKEGRSYWAGIVHGSKVLFVSRPYNRKSSLVRSIERLAKNFVISKWSFE